MSAVSSSDVSFCAGPEDEYIMLEPGQKLYFLCVGGGWSVESYGVSSGAVVCRLPEEVAEEGWAQEGIDALEEEEGWGEELDWEDEALEEEDWDEEESAILTALLASARE